MNIQTSATDSCLDSVMGAAAFDLSGLPREYFTTAENRDINWVQMVFQSLGLRSLLMSSLQLEGFHHTIAHGTGYFAVIVKQRDGYLALLVKQTGLRGVSNTLIRWAQTLDLKVLRTDSRFDKS